jgi:hypothetical protein
VREAVAALERALGLAVARVEDDPADRPVTGAETIGVASWATRLAVSAGLSQIDERHAAAPGLSRD